MGCNRKVKLLFSELFSGWEDVQKVTFLAVPAGPSFMKSIMAAKRIYESKKTAV